MSVASSAGWSAMARGLADPVHDSQGAFRAVMRAFAGPGRIETLDLDLDPPTPLSVAAAAAFLALADFETPLWLSPSLRETEKVADYLRFHTGAELAGAPNASAFAVVDARRDALALSDFAQGTAEYPDRSTTVILLCDSLAADGPLLLSGPGVRGSAALGFAPAPADFAAQWALNRAAFPLGVDIVFAAGREFAALPRSTRILSEAA